MKEKDISALIKYRLEKAQTAFDDARYLLEGNRSSQSIINRSYYAMFYAALALLEKIGVAPKKHSGVIRIFDKEFVQKGIFSREFSKDFHKAFELRQVSDYRASDEPTKEEVNEILESALRFINAIQKYLL